MYVYMWFCVCVCGLAYVFSSGGFSIGKFHFPFCQNSIFVSVFTLVSVTGFSVCIVVHIGSSPMDRIRANFSQALFPTWLEVGDWFMLQLWTGGLRFSDFLLLKIDCFSCVWTQLRKLQFGSCEQNCATNHHVLKNRVTPLTIDEANLQPLYGNSVPYRK